MTDLRAEHELLLCVARKSLDAATAERLHSLVRRDLDWAYLSEMAHWHGVIPLLYYHLRALSTARVSEQALNQLRDDNIENTKSSLLLTAELLKLLRLLDAHGISAIPYKGPALAASAYGDVALRQFGDLDILVRKRDVLGVKELLVARGCQSEFKLTNAQEAALLRYYYEYPFICNENRVLVEIHWQITERYFSFEFDVDQLWDRLEIVTIGSKQVPTLSLEDSLLILCVHNSKHLWNRLGWISDVASLITGRKDVNWPLLFENATTLGSRRMLLLGLSLASNLLAAPLPEEISALVRADFAVRTLAERVQSQLFLERKVPPTIFETAVMHLRMRERKRDRLRYCLRLVFTTTLNDWLLLPLPGWLFSLYYLMRPLRLAAKYGAKLLKRSREEPQSK